MLEAEFDRTIVSFRRMSDVWTQLASKVDAPGSAAYAHRKAIMYQGLEDDYVQVVVPLLFEKQQVVAFLA